METTPRIVTAPNGEMNIQIGSKTLYSRYNPRGSSERIVNQIEILNRTIYMIPSPLLGYGIKDLLDRIPEDSLVLAIEAEQDLMVLTAPYLKELQNHPRCRIYRISEPAALYHLFHKIEPEKYRTCRMTPLNGGYNSSKKIYDGLFSSLQSYQQYYWRNRLTTAKLGRLWMKNLLMNLASPERMNLGDFKTPRPVLLTGAGESLEEVIPFIHNNREQLFVLCVDTAAQTLMRNRILPDGIVNLEAQFHNLKDFYSLKGFKVRQFSDITAYPPSLRDFPGDHYFFSSRFGVNDLLEKLEKRRLLPPEIPALGSVGVTALYVAGQITDGPVFLAGLDFSYLEGKSHARETPLHDWMRLRENRLQSDPWALFTLERPSIPARSKNADPRLRTNSVLLQYGHQLQDMCQFMTGRVFDITETGLELEIPRLSREDAADLLKKTRQSPALVKPSSNEAIDRPYESFRDLLKNELDKLDRIVLMWHQINSKTIEPDRLCSLLQECSYTFFHFPDSHMLPNTRPEFLFRAMSSVYSYRRIFTGILKN